MNDVPLVNANDINSINTSIIAIKKQLRQLNEAVGLIDTPDVNIDLAPFVKKSDVVDVVQSGNLNPVTSNAVAEKFKENVCIHSIKVSYQESVTIPFGNWGFGYCNGNIDGSGNFAFEFSKSGSSYAVKNSSLGNAFQNATLSNNVIRVGTANYGFTLTFNSDTTITFAWAGVQTTNVFGRIAFIGMGSNVI